MTNNNQKNVFGEVVETCSENPITGFFRDGCCNTAETDFGRHFICTLMTEEFLKFSKENGNDLSAPIPEFNFPGLKPGDKWCLCAMRWKEAYDNNCAPNIFLLSTNSKVLEMIPLEILRIYAIDLE